MVVFAKECKVRPCDAIGTLGVDGKRGARKPLNAFPLGLCQLFAAFGLELAEGHIGNAFWVARKKANSSQCLRS